MLSWSREIYENVFEGDVFPSLNGLPGQVLLALWPQLLVASSNQESTTILLHSSRMFGFYNTAGDHHDGFLTSTVWL